MSHVVYRFGNSRRRFVKLSAAAGLADSTDCSPTDDIASLLPVGSDRSIGLQCLGQSMFFRVGRERSCKVGEPVTLSINRRLHLSIRRAA
jgi:hypothetical protein